jgi:hypothetical protein
LKTEYHDTDNKGFTRSSMLETALGYAARGIPVFSLKGKTPLTPHGFKDASTDPSRVTAMFNAARSATGFGIPTGGVSGLVVVDRDGDSEEARRIWDSLPPTLEVATSRGRHRYYSVSKDTKVKSRKLADDVDLKADGGYAAAPGSLHPSGARYRIVEATRAVGVAELPLHLLTESKTDHDPSRRREASTPFIDAGGPIHEGGRNRALTSTCGRLHDGRRDQDQLYTDLMAINEARCTPPLEADEVAKIARSIYGRTPCKAAPEVTPEVVAIVDELEAAASERAVKGIRGASGWAIYHAGLDLLRHYGREHPDGVGLDIDVRTWALNAGCCAATVSKFIRRSPLVGYEKRGLGRKHSTVVFKAPPKIGVQSKHSSTRGVSIEKTPPCSVYARPLFRTLYRLRWGAGRIGKSRAALLTAVVECPGAARHELADRLGRKPDSLKKPLKWLTEASLLIRVGRGRYDVPEDFAKRIDDAREMAGEPLADRLQMARHERERDGYRNRTKADRAPAEGEMRKRRESFPDRRRQAIERAIAALFADRPEYRARRVGQITCTLIRNYVPEDFPRGDIGMPRDREVEVILDGEAA